MHHDRARSTAIDSPGTSHGGSNVWMAKKNGVCVDGSRRYAVPARLVGSSPSDAGWCAINDKIVTKERCMYVLLRLIKL